MAALHRLSSCGVASASTQAQHAHLCPPLPRYGPAPLSIVRQPVASTSGRDAPPSATSRRAWHRTNRGHRHRTRASSTDDNPGVYTGEDFYSLLGLTPRADALEIKRAYRSLIRELHPDLVATAGQDIRNQANELTMLLNQVYETLTDPDARAIYDMLAGFADETSVNPFDDTSFARDQVFVDECTCIGCGKCVRACPDTFEIEASKYGRARVISQTAEPPEDIQIAIEVCPVSCIYWVSLPQLSLLEAALTVMPRVEVFVMQRSGKPPGNVFEVAYKSYERRRAAANAKAAESVANKRVQVDWTWWSVRTESSDTQDNTSTEDTQQGVDGQQQRRVAGLAAAAARAVRMWQAQGRALRIKGLVADTSSSSLSSFSTSSSLSD